MKFLIFCGILVSCSMGALRGAGESPFPGKFGGPYKAGVDPGFRATALKLGMTWKAAFAAVGIAGMEDPESFRSFVEEEIDPQLASLNARTNEERKLKEAALFLKEAMSLPANRAKMKEKQVREIEEFLNACTEPLEPKSPEERFANLLLLYSDFVRGGLAGEMEEPDKKDPAK